MSHIVDYLRHTTSRSSEDSGLEELCNMLDPEHKDVSIDLDTYHAVMREWIDDCRNHGYRAPSEKPLFFNSNSPVATVTEAPTRPDFQRSALNSAAEALFLRAESDMAPRVPPTFPHYFAAPAGPLRPQQLPSRPLSPLLVFRLRAGAVSHFRVMQGLLADTAFVWAGSASGGSGL